MVPQAVSVGFRPSAAESAGALIRLICSHENAAFAGQIAGPRLKAAIGVDDLDAADIPADNAVRRLAGPASSPGT